MKRLVALIITLAFPLLFTDGASAMAYDCHSHDIDIANSIQDAIDEKYLLKNKKAPDTFIDVEVLSEDKRYLVEKIMSLSDDEVRSLRTIVDQVLALRGK